MGLLNLGFAHGAARLALAVIRGCIEPLVHTLQMEAMTTGRQLPQQLPTGKIFAADGASNAAAKQPLRD
jgi:hypothetical protein